MSFIVKKFTQTFHHSSVPVLAGTTHVVTGGTNGIGLSVARTLFTHGANIYVLGHQQSVGEAALKFIRTGDLKSAPQSYSDGFGLQSDKSGEGGSVDGTVEFLQVNMEDLSAVAKVGKDLAGKLDRLDRFWGIAGKGINAFSLTKDGYDSHLTLNNWAHYVLLSHLLPLLVKTSKLPDSDVRILQMSSELHRATFGGPDPKWGGDKFTSKDELKKDIGPDNLYARTKLGVILFTRALIDRYLKGTSIKAFACHPGAIATGQQHQMQAAYGKVLGSIGEKVSRSMMSTPDQGSISILWAGTAPEARNDEDYPNGSYITAEETAGGETSEAQDETLINNFWNISTDVITEVAGEEALGPWKV